MIYRVLGVSAASLLFQACYGMPLDWMDDAAIRGTVLSGQTNGPIRGIQVSIKDIPSRAYTDQYGNFSIYVPLQDEYKLKFEDIDGPENGSYQIFKTRVDLTEASNPLQVYLEAADPAGSGAQ